MKDKNVLYILLSIAVAAMGVLVALAVLFAQWLHTGLMPAAMLPLAYTGLGLGVVFAGLGLGAWLWFRRR